MNQYYTYIYLDPRKPGKFSYPNLNMSFLYEPFYVGRGKGYRMFEHIAESKRNNKTYKERKINKIIKDGYNLKSYIINYESKLNFDESEENEIILIRNIGRYKFGGVLTNLDEGGGGIKGFNHSEETKKKMSNTRKGINTISKELRKKIIAKGMITKKLNGTINVAFDEVNKRSSEERKRMSKKAMITKKLNGTDKKWYIASMNRSKAEKRDSYLKSIETKKNKGISLSECSKKAWVTRRNNGNCGGANNYNAKKYLIISPNNDEYEVVGGLQKFCKRHNLSYTALKNKIDKGLICESKFHNTKLSNNTIGWSISTVNNSR